MSRLYPSPFDIQKLGYVCRYCGAAPGIWCTTASDRWSTHLHGDRYYQARPCSQRPAGTDFPRDAIAEERLARAIAATAGGVA